MGVENLIAKKELKRVSIISLFIAIEGQRLTAYSPTPLPNEGRRKGKKVNPIP